MAIYQRLAFWQLVICVATATSVGTLGVIFGWRGAFGGFGLLWLCALPPLLAFFWRLRKRNVVADERDRAIQMRALQVTFGVVWASLFLAWGFVFLNGGIDASVPLDAITRFLLVLVFLLLFSNSVAVLVGYGSCDSK